MRRRGTGPKSDTHTISFIDINFENATYYLINLRGFFRHHTSCYAFYGWWGPLGLPTVAHLSAFASTTSNPPLTIVEPRSDQSAAIVQLYSKTETL
ncbi:uncharacterized protein N7529_008670 [Penicillium soppii]|uniref:uncharacterized protein n=1 Tax=Penicillium soppii TaxID=69789 RepID=UPI0025494D0E|nr:uncharacterized protein N7529_008670 [Penicillium soppii]KAJ5861360.1 hypothetical protein N7529_008670 [Penicillium soppii]